MPATRTPWPDLHALAIAFGRGEHRDHTPTEDTYGRTCDERGCAICNLGESEYAEDYAALALNPYADAWPDDDELADYLDPDRLGDPLDASLPLPFYPLNESETA